MRIRLNEGQGRVSFLFPGQLVERKHEVGGRLVAVASHSYNERGRLTKLFRQADIQTHLHSADRELPLLLNLPLLLWFNRFIIIKLMGC